MIKFSNKHHTTTNQWKTTYKIQRWKKKVIIGTSNKTIIVADPINKGILKDNLFIISLNDQQTMNENFDQNWLNMILAQLFFGGKTDPW